MPHIRADKISIEFPIYDVSHRSLKNAVLRATTGGRFTSRAKTTVVQALDEVSFEFDDGDRIGLMGHNGSGKTTLLRTLAGIYDPVRGNLDVEGKVASLLDVSHGISPEATGYENITLRGVMAGLSLREVRERIDEIASFTELGDYLEMPVRTYSSGMLLRLAFAVATSVSADIILMDEWLSVGDASFREKADKRLDRMIARSAILVLASHSSELLFKHCNRIFCLERGKVVEMTSEGVSK